MNNWDWVDYETYEWLYYNNPKRYIVGAIQVRGERKPRVKWGTDKDRERAIAKAKDSQKLY